MRKNLAAVLLTSATVVLMAVAAVAQMAERGRPLPPGPKPPSATTQAEQEMKVGKKDDVTFTKEVRVGDVTLARGKYRLQHRVDGSEHFVRFEALATTIPSAQKSTAGLAVPASHADDVKCRLEALSEKVTATTVHLLSEADGQRITKILVRGENVAHVL